MAHPNQGRAFKIADIEGEWIVGGNYFFLIPDADADKVLPFEEGEQIFTEVFSVDGHDVHGVDANAVAAELKITGNALLELNRAEKVTAKTIAALPKSLPTLSLATPKGTVMVGMSCE